MELKNKLFGYEIEYMPNILFRLMSLVLGIRDIFFNVGKKLDQFNIEKGFVVLDFGCGPGSFVEYASKLVGINGKVYAIDVQPLAIKAIKKKTNFKKLENIIPVLLTIYPVNVPSRVADVIYALDMFHHVKDTIGFLGELHRLSKPSGTLFIESGHQSINNARQKILKSGFWIIIKENGNMFECISKENEIA